MDLTPYHAALLKANTVIVSLLDKKRELLKENRDLEDFIGVNTLKANNGVTKAIQAETNSSCDITSSKINQHDSSSDLSKIVVALQAANNTISKLKEDIETLTIKCDKLKRTRNNLKNDENEILETIPTKKMKALNTNMFDNKNQFDACYNKLNDLYINSSLNSEADDAKYNRLIAINEGGKYLDPNIMYFRVNGKKKESRFDLLDGNKAVYRNSSVGNNKIVYALFKCVKSDNVGDISLALFSFSHSIVLNELLAICKEIVDECCANTMKSESAGADKLATIKRILQETRSQMYLYTAIIQSFAHYPYGHSYINNFVCSLHTSILGFIKSQLRHPLLYVVHNVNIVRDELQLNTEIDHGDGANSNLVYDGNESFGVDSESHLNNYIVDLEDESKEIAEDITSESRDDADDLLTYKNEVVDLEHEDKVQKAVVSQDIPPTESSVKLSTDVKDQIYLFLYTTAFCNIVTTVPNFASLLLQFITGLSLSVQSFGTELNIGSLYGLFHSCFTPRDSDPPKYAMLSILHDEVFRVLLKSMVSSLANRYELHCRDISAYLETICPVFSFNSASVVACLGCLCIDLLSSLTLSDTANADGKTMCALDSLKGDPLSDTGLLGGVKSIRDIISHNYLSDQSSLVPRSMYMKTLLNARGEGFFGALQTIAYSPSASSLCDPFGDVGLDFVKQQSEMCSNFLEICQFKSVCTVSSYATRVISQELPCVPLDAGSLDPFSLEKHALDYYITFWTSKVTVAGGLPAPTAASIVGSLNTIKILFESIYFTEFDGLNTGWRSNFGGQDLLLESKINVKLNQGRQYLKKMNVSWYKHQGRTQPIDVKSIQLFALGTVSPDLLLDACIFLDTCIETLTTGAFEDSDKLQVKLREICADLSSYVTIACIERMNFIVLCSLRSLLAVASSSLNRLNESERKVLLPLVHTTIQYMITTYSDFGLDVCSRADIIHEIISAIRILKSEERTQEELHWASLQQTKLPIFVINLNRRYDRFNQMMKLCKEEGMIAIRYAAIDAKELVHSADKYHIPETDVVVNWDSSLNCKFVTNTFNSKTIPMTDTERACAASHLAVWRIIVDYRRNFLNIPIDKVASVAHPPNSTLSISKDMRNVIKGVLRFTSISNMNYEPVMITNSLGIQDDWYFILEDDARLKANRQRAKKFINQLVHNVIPSDFDILFLGYFANNSMNLNEFRKEKIRFRRINYVHGLHAYLVKGKSLELILNQHLPISGPVDNYIGALINAGNLHAYAIADKLFIQHDKLKKSNIIHSGRI